MFVPRNPSENVFETCRTTPLERATCAVKLRWHDTCPGQLRVMDISLQESDKLVSGWKLD